MEDGLVARKLYKEVIIPTSLDFTISEPNMIIKSKKLSIMALICKHRDKVCVFDLEQVFSGNLSLHFYKQSEMNSEDDTK